jgi:hypothetical protein
MFFLVMPALDAGIHVLNKGVDDRDKPGHDDKDCIPPSLRELQ